MQSLCQPQQRTREAYKAIHAHEVLWPVVAEGHDAPVLQSGRSSANVRCSAIALEDAWAKPSNERQYSREELTLPVAIKRTRGNGNLECLATAT